MEMVAVMNAANPMPRCMDPSEAVFEHIDAARKTLNGTAVVDTRLSTVIELPAGIRGTTSPVPNSRGSIDTVAAHIPNNTAMATTHVPSALPSVSTSPRKRAMSVSAPVPKLPRIRNHQTSS